VHFADADADPSQHTPLVQATPGETLRLSLIKCRPRLRALRPLRGRRCVSNRAPCSTGGVLVGRWCAGRPVVCWSAGGVLVGRWCAGRDSPTLRNIRSG